MITFKLNLEMLPRSSSIVLMVTEHLAISTSTSKVSPSELCNLMFGIMSIGSEKLKYKIKERYEKKTYMEI
jgi:hypothetical protein